MTPEQINALVAKAAAVVECGNRAVVALSAPVAPMTVPTSPASPEAAAADAEVAALTAAAPQRNAEIYLAKARAAAMDLAGMFPS